MRKEKEISSAELETLADGLGQTFIQRWDMYPRQMDNGSYICIKKPLTQNHLLLHLRGKITLGVYLLDQKSQSRFIVVDADDEEQYVQMVEMANILADQDIPSYLERSRRGGHLWFFFEEPIPGKDARLFGKGLLAAHGMPADIELYPKQDALKEGPGSLIRLPFGIHRKDGKRYGFIDPSGVKLAPLLRDQIPLFFAPKTVSGATVDEFRQRRKAKPQKPEFTPSEAQGETLSQSIKAAISVQDFVGKYVELTSVGRGHCPFHDDQNRSFSVNAEENYWHCFAGCGGGTIIDFWMKYKNTDFTRAVNELRSLLLKNNC
jgi:hypothetical protein